ncbi:MAG: hypothetical protein H7Y59_15120 [Anaerolineales bacterium]|nr:hypothetical protein [Anaerolineales bacterium]
MFDTSEKNPTIPSYLYWITWVECSVVFMAAVLLFFLPGVAQNLWAWEIPPYNSRFVGTIYFSAYIPLIILWVTKRWSPGRLILWMIFVFTASVMLVMFIHWESFAWSRMATYLVFWPLYIFLPINSALHLYWYRNVEAPPATQMPASWRSLLFGMALLLTAYGLGLLIAPESLTRFWPWPVDAFHGQMYASAFLTPAVGCWWLAYYGETPAEDLVIGLNLLSAGFLTITGILLTSVAAPAERQVDLLAPGVWAFIFMFAFSGVVGLALTLRARSKRLTLQ